MAGVRMPRQYVFAMVDGFGWGWVGAVVDLTRARSEVEAAGLRARRLRRRRRVDQRVVEGGRRGRI